MQFQRKDKGKIKMITNKITINKIVKTVELVCPMLKEKLVTEIYIVGSVAKGTAKEGSDIDVYLINPLFKYQDHQWQTIIRPGLLTKKDIHIKKIVSYLTSVGVEFEIIEMKKGDHTYQLYEDEIFHFMYDYESESIKKAGEYIEITEELCNQISELE